MKPTIAKELFLEALIMWVCQRKPTQELIVQLDQGIQYGSNNCKRFCEANQLLPTIGRLAITRTT
jgi:putative transposase